MITFSTSIKRESLSASNPASSAYSHTCLLTHAILPGLLNQVNGQVSYALKCSLAEDAVLSGNPAISLNRFFTYTVCQDEERMQRGVQAC